MAKKQKRNLQKLIAKKQQIQQASQGPIVTFTEPIEVIEKKTETPQAIQRISDEEIQSKHVSLELKKTAFSLAVIILLFAGAIVLDRRTSYVNDLGSWLYSALKLDS